MSQTKPIAVPDRSPRKVGVVESDVRDKTRRVAVRFSAKHRKYGKYIKRRTVLHVHDEGNVSKRGDMVEVAECRPLSKTKSWILVQVLKESAAVS